MVVVSHVEECDYDVVSYITAATDRSIANRPQVFNLPHKATGPQAMPLADARGSFIRRNQGTPVGEGMKSSQTAISITSRKGVETSLGAARMSRCATRVKIAEVFIASVPLVVAPENGGDGALVLKDLNDVVDGFERDVVDY